VEWTHIPSQSVSLAQTLAYSTSMRKNVHSKISQSRSPQRRNYSLDKFSMVSIIVIADLRRPAQSAVGEQLSLAS